MSAVNKYFLDNIDMYSAYGYIATSGSDSMLQLPKRKEPLSHDWKDQNGIEYDLSAPPVYETRTISLKGFIVAINEADFWTKYNALKEVLFTNGTKLLRCEEIDTEINVFYYDCSNIKRRTRIKNTDLIGMELDLIFKEVGSPVAPTAFVLTDDTYLDG